MLHNTDPSILWGLILPYLRNPVPAPRSAPPRSALRQTALATAMRVSKMFQAICEPLVYRHLVTDSLPDILSHCRSPSMQRQLSHTRSIYIEYMPLEFAPSYPELLRSSSLLWRLVGPSEADAEKATLQLCEHEVDDLSQALNQLMAVEEETKSSLFHRLHSVAVSSIYGCGGGRWERYADRQWDNGTEANLTECSTAFHSWLDSMESLRHLCVRDPTGPLNLGVVSWASNPNGHKIQFSVTQHFPATVEVVYLTLGVPIRWVYDGPMTADTQVVIDNLWKAIEAANGLRRAHPEIKDIAMVQIFCSTDIHSMVMPDAPPGTFFPPEPFTRSQQSRMAAQLTESAQEVFRKMSGRKDLIQWYSSTATPTCLACSSGAPA